MDDAATLLAALALHNPAGAAMKLSGNYSKYLALLRLGAFERHHRDGWRFGTRKIADSVVERLVASGRAAIAGEQLIICQRPEAEP